MYPLSYPLARSHILNWDTTEYSLLLNVCLPCTEERSNMSLSRIYCITRSTWDSSVIWLATWFWVFNLLSSVCWVGSPTILLFVNRFVEFEVLSLSFHLLFVVNDVVRQNIYAFTWMTSLGTSKQLHYKLEVMVDIKHGGTPNFRRKMHVLSHIVPIQEYNIFFIFFRSVVKTMVRSIQVKVLPLIEFKFEFGIFDNTYLFR